MHDDEAQLLARELPARPTPRSRELAVLGELFRSLRSPSLAHVRRLAVAVEALAPESGSVPRPTVRLVGGFVRDTILGLECKDIDVEVYGVGPARLAVLLEGLYPGRVLQVGRAFGVFKVCLEDALELDVSIPRRESSPDPAQRDLEVRGDPSLTPAEAARRRDFTMNALAVDPRTGELLDEFDGLEDLARGVLRVTDPRTFVEDPLRVHRAAQFAARFQLTLEPATETLLRDMVARGDLDALPSERVTEELRKLLLRSPAPSVGFEWLRSLGVIERFHPELAALVGCPQEPDWHPEGDVWIHTMMTLDAAARLVRLPTRQISSEQALDILVGALCHDLGKPATTAILDGRITSRGHDQAGVEPTRTFLARFDFAERVAHAAVACAAQHLMPMTLFLQRERGHLDERGYTKAVGRVLRKVQPADVETFLTVSEADSRGRGLPGAATQPYLAGRELRTTVERFELMREALTPLLRGRDLLALGFSPGPAVGRALARIEELRDRGKIETREQALRIAGDELKNHAPARSGKSSRDSTEP